MSRAGATSGAMRALPPAVFPPVFGLLGLGLAWRGAGALGAPAGVGEALIVFAAALYTLLVALYLAPRLRRPAMLAAELGTVPGRAGLSAATLTLLLLAVAAARPVPGLAHALLLAGLVLHVALAVAVVRALLAAPPEGRRVTPAWHLSFVGFVLVPLSALPLGHVALAQVTTVFAALAAGLVYGVSVAQLLRAPPPAPARPLLAIHLAPPSLFGAVALGFGRIGVALVFLALSLVVFAALAARWRALTAAGPSPLWGAFTFPLAAFAGLLVLVAGGPGPGWLAVPAWAALALATLGVPGLATVAMTSALRAARR